MKFARLSLVLVLMVTISSVVVPQVQSQTVPQAAAPAASAGAPSVDALPPFAVWLKAGGSPAHTKAKGGLKARAHKSGAKSAELACDDFWILCNDGSADSCCGSVNSCLFYCEEFCGGPCVYED
ncbi:MAG TPA: hypothetical protein VMM92_09780 [Thermoanaerobaculia bacterium]|nr:hypothetical protein [Thermoanaerobaculia bacterium]